MLNSNLNKSLHAVHFIRNFFFLSRILASDLDKIDGFLVNQLKDFILIQQKLTWVSVYV